MLDLSLEMAVGPKIGLADGEASPARSLPEIATFEDVFGTQNVPIAGKLQTDRKLTLPSNDPVTAHISEDLPSGHATDADTDIALFSLMTPEGSPDEPQVKTAAGRATPDAVPVSALAPGETLSRERLPDVLPPSSRFVATGRVANIPPQMTAPSVAPPGESLASEPGKTAALSGKIADITVGQTPGLPLALQETMSSAIRSAPTATPTANLQSLPAFDAAQPAMWIEAATAAISIASLSAAKEARFSLTPPELGTLSVTLGANENELRVEIAAGADAAQQELERHLPRLLERLREELAQASTATGRDNNPAGHDGAASGRSDRTGSDGDRSAQDRTDRASEHAEHDVVDVPSPTATLTSKVGRVSLFA
ncbi:MAG: flagellar hook-length control protein FliK [Pacificimonas sp.]